MDRGQEHESFNPANANLPVMPGHDFGPRHIQHVRQPTPYHVDMNYAPVPPRFIRHPNPVHPSNYDATRSTVPGSTFQGNFNSRPGNFQNRFLNFDVRIPAVSRNYSPPQRMPNSVERWPPQLFNFNYPPPPINDLHRPVYEQKDSGGGKALNFGHPALHGNVAVCSVDRNKTVDGLSSTEWPVKSTKTKSKFTTVKLPLVKQRLAKFAGLLEKLKCCTDAKLLESYQQEMLDIRGTLDDKSIELAARKMKLLSKKRGSTRRRRCRQLKEATRRAESRERLHQKIDKQMQQVAAAMAEKKKEDEMKKAADKVLGEVRRKKQDIDQLLQLYTKTLKLREVRKLSYHNRGLVTSEADDEKFEEKLSLLTSLAQQRNDIYKAEERALQVMLYEESERDVDSTERMKRKTNENQKELKARKRLLFQCSLVCNDEAMRPFMEFYDVASRSWDILVAIRREWDAHIVPPFSTGGSSIPLSWVMPAEPSSDEWASCLVKNLP